MKKSISHFLWPKVKFRLSNIFGNCQSEQIEKRFHQMFPSGQPVLCSSGRAALYMVIKECNLLREDHVNLFPYASHCVINSIARLTNPIPYRKNDKSNGNKTYKIHRVFLIQQNDFTLSFLLKL